MVSRAPCVVCILADAVVPFTLCVRVIIAGEVGRAAVWPCETYGGRLTKLQPCIGTVRHFSQWMCRKPGFLQPAPAT